MNSISKVFGDVGVWMLFGGVSRIVSVDLGGFEAFLDALWRRFPNSVHRFGEDFGAFLDAFWRRFPNTLHRFGENFGALGSSRWGLGGRK